jgi:hypothetical protein
MLLIKLGLFLKQFLPKFCYFIQFCCICHCELSRKKDHGFWDRESGGICPDCLKEFYPEAYESMQENECSEIRQAAEN